MKNPRENLKHSGAKKCHSASVVVSRAVLGESANTGGCLFVSGHGGKGYNGERKREEMQGIEMNGKGGARYVVPRSQQTLDGAGVLLS